MEQRAGEKELGFWEATHGASSAKARSGCTAIPAEQGQQVLKRWGAGNEKQQGGNEAAGNEAAGNEAVVGGRQ